MNNYQRPVNSGNLGNMVPKVDHIDLIVGDVGAKAAPGTAACDVAVNASTRVSKRFTSADWTLDADGYYTIHHTVTASKSHYFRLRGTNLGENVPNLTANGEALADQAVDTADNAQRHDQINDRNYGSLWFYSNPIFVSVQPVVLFEPDLREREVGAAQAQRRCGETQARRNNPSRCASSAASARELTLSLR